MVVCLSVKQGVRRGRGVSVVAVVILGLLVGAVGAQGDDLAVQREQVRQRQVEVASGVDALRAETGDLVAALDTLDRDVTTQSGRADNARQAVASANAEAKTADAKALAAERELASLRGDLVDFAIASYMRPPDLQSAETFVGSDALEAPKRQALTRVGMQDSTAVLDRISVVREDQRRARTAAIRARADAARLESEESRRLGELETARDRQAALAGEVEDRLDRALAESAHLQTRDADLAGQIKAQQDELAARLANSRRVNPVPAPSVSSGSRSGSPRIVSVRGIEVAEEIADNLAALLAAADRDGVTLDGSGYRDSATQIFLRKQHCGTSDYAIWDMPSSDCSPPVARPGRSMHEQGLAVDFIVGSDLIRSRSTSAYGWLVANANRFGFYNLPSEPWHWSTTGS